jgi:hypothetical protein
MQYHAVCVLAGHPLTQLSTRASPSYERDTLIRQRSRYTHAQPGLRLYAALAHVHITCTQLQGRAVRLSVTPAVHVVLHPGFVRISGNPRYAGYVRLGA